MSISLLFYPLTPLWCVLVCVFYYCRTYYKAVRVGSSIVMYKMTVGKGVVYVYEAYEAK